uniref:Uncharacterized protein n=1 Tax=Varanus komodoensis TaxID=61221 RepID=A0A8D2J1P6_VARKO
GRAGVHRSTSCPKGPASRTAASPGCPRTRVPGRLRNPAISPELFLHSRPFSKFQFLLCERCREDIHSPKLLPCLHSLCTTCLEENKPIGLCPICGTAHTQNADAPQIQKNLLFANLQAKLNIYRKVVGGKRIICDNCKKDGEFWCSECEEFICRTCFESHQRYLKRENHEAKSLKDLQMESSRDFLASIRKQSTMLCSRKDHRTHSLSIYCNECQQSMCCICALLDSRHTGRHCDIRAEIQRRQEELQNMSVELRSKKGLYDAAYNGLLEQLGDMERARNEARERIQRQIEETMRVLREKEERCLAVVEDHHQQQVQEVTAQLRDIEGVVKRMEASEQLVEKMQLYSTDQELLEMHPFIKRSLEELGTKPVPAVRFQTQVGKFTEIHAQLQAQLEQGPILKSPAKRKHIQEERAVQTPLKVIKAEPEDREWGDAGNLGLPEQPGTSSESLRGNSAVRNGDSLGENEANSNRVPLSETIGRKTLLTRCGSIGTSPVLALDVLHLVVAADETHSFSVMIQPLLASPANHMKSSLCEIGLDSLLSYLETLHRPILVGYKIWSMKLPVLVETLRNIDKEERFKAAILGFLDALPLLQEAIPDLTNYTLKYLDSIYLWGQLDESQAFECAKTLKDLCTVLDINPTMMAWGPVVSYSSVQCYCSLQPLLGEKLLSRSSVQTLALHNCSLSVLQSVHQNDPAKGLEKLSRHLNARRRKGEKKIRRLQKIGFFFQALPAGAWPHGPVGIPSGARRGFGVRGSQAWAAHLAAPCVS